MKVVEIFQSVQGEGRFIGHLMTFVRLFGCNLRCKYCDSEYSWKGPHYSDMSVADVVRHVRMYDNRWVCITGGEPLVQKRELGSLINQLLAREYKVLVETNGSLPIWEVYRYRDVLWDVDVKGPSSGEEGSFLKENLRYINPPDYLKFVVGSEGDYKFLVDFLKWLSNSEDYHYVDIVVQPEGSLPTERVTGILERLKDEKLPERIRTHVRFLPQWHRILYGSKRGV